MMDFEKEFEIHQFAFCADLQGKFDNIHYAKEQWPAVYILSNDDIKEAYIGETTDPYARMSTHLKNDVKKNLSHLYLITSGKFHKSATLDIESNLIKYISGDGKYKLINANIGVANHNYYQKNEVYWSFFKSIWNKLCSKGIAKHTIEYITNSDLFRYSPYKSLNRDQRAGLLGIMRNLLGNSRVDIVKGGAGTGKTILAIFLFKLLNSDIEDFNFEEFDEDKEEFISIIKELKTRYPAPKMALVVPMASFRGTLKKVFKNIRGLSDDMVVAPSEIVNGRFDIVLVDESHRLRRRIALGPYFKIFDQTCQILGMDKQRSNELDWLLHRSDKLILFYDDEQSIRPSDIREAVFDDLRGKPDTSRQELKSQLRLKGGNDYVEYVRKLMSCAFQPGDKIFSSKQYSFLLFDSLTDLIAEIREREKEHGLSRLAAGYSWKWVSKKNKDLFDIDIEGVSLKWNSVTSDWINSPNALNEIGCIHTTQGYDLNYAGIIFGNEISYDKEKNEIVVRKEHYHDKSGKLSIKDPDELKGYIYRIYSTLLKRGINGTYVYACDPNLREYFAGHIENAKPRSVSPLISYGRTPSFDNSVKLYDVKAAAGNFGDPQQADDFKWIQIPLDIKASDDLFACQVVGESMNRVIPGGAVCLFRKYQGGSRDGKIALVRHAAIHDRDLGPGLAVKEYRSKKIVTEAGWEHIQIILYPLSDDPSYQPIKITEEESYDLKVIGIFERVLYTDGI